MAWQLGIGSCLKADTSEYTVVVTGQQWRGNTAKLRKEHVATALKSQPIKWDLLSTTPSANFLFALYRRLWWTECWASDASSFWRANINRKKNIVFSYNAFINKPCHFCELGNLVGKIYSNRWVKWSGCSLLCQHNAQHELSTKRTTWRVTLWGKRKLWL